MKSNLPKNCIDVLQDGVASLGLGLNERQYYQLFEFTELLIKWNKAFNLTAITDPKEMIIKHLLDSLIVSEHIEVDSVVDVGTGAGIPGIPLSIVFPNTSFALVDSNGKKVRFIQQVKQHLSLHNISPIQSRVENFGLVQTNNEIQKYDVVISRAFASLEKMFKLSHHLVKDSGTILAMKGKLPSEADTQYILDQGWNIESTVELNVPYLKEDRRLITIRK